MNWQYVRLGDVIAEARPGFASGSDVSDGIAQLRMNNLTRDGKLDWSKVRRVDLPKKSITYSSPRVMCYSMQPIVLTSWAKLPSLMASMSQ